MNIVILRGNVGSAPDIRKFNDGGVIASFSMATTKRGYTTRDGREVPDKTEWHNISVRSSGLAGVVERYVGKGTPLLVRGSLESRIYQDRDGNARKITEVVVDELELLGDGKAPGQHRRQDDDEDLPV